MSGFLFIRFCFCCLLSFRERKDQDQDSVDKDRSTCNNKDGSVGHISRCYESDEERKQELTQADGEFRKQIRY